MTNSSRPRGRPKGSKDSYQRQRKCTKKPPATTLELVMPPIRNLIKAAKTQGIVIGAGQPDGPAEEDVERAVTILLAAIREAMQPEYQPVDSIHEKVITEALESAKNL